MEPASLVGAGKATLNTMVLILMIGKITRNAGKRYEKHENINPEKQENEKENKKDDVIVMTP